ncbi:MAG: DUF2520 domain-containing protein [Myxococcales bacterium]|nr:DUF2520 domain-containing protein [Myxococcales bacterium]
MSAPQQSILVIGAGKLGTALAVALARVGHTVTVFARDLAKTAQWQPSFAGVVIDHFADAQFATAQFATAQFAIVLVCVPDRAMVVAAQAAVQGGVRGAVWLHTAGAMAGDLLADTIADAPTGSIHPLAAVDGPGDPDPLVGALYAVAGNPAAIKVAHELARQLGGQAVEIADEARSAYHTAAALVANDWVALFAVAEQVARRSDLDPALLRRGLLHLAHTSLERLANLPLTTDIVTGLTGAARRGDAETLAKHMAQLQSDPSGLAVHRAATQVLVQRLMALHLLSQDAGQRCLQALAAAD